MNWYANMKMTGKLLFGFIIVAIVAGVIGVFSMINIRTMQESDQRMYANMTVPIQEAAQIAIDFQQVRN